MIKIRLLILYLNELVLREKYLSFTLLFKSKGVKQGYILKNEVLI